MAYRHAFFLCSRTMTVNPLIKNRLRYEIARQKKLTGDEIDAMVENISTMLEHQRLTIAPTYLTDDMFDAQKEVCPDITFKESDKLWVAAWKHHAYKPVQPIDNDDEQGSFW
jgi:hypothetical protein